MSRGILTVGENWTFDELDASLGQFTSPPVANVAVPPQALPGASTTPNILTSIASILGSGAQAYGSYTTAVAARRQPKPPPMMQYPPGYAPSVAPTSAGLTGTQLALIIGGGVLVLGVGAILLFRK